MAGILNNTARQYNLKCIGKNKSRHVVRAAPGLNDVEDAHWKPFLTDPYTLDLKKQKLIDFGEAIDDLLFEKEPDTKSKSKVSPPPGGPANTGPTEVASMEEVKKAITAFTKKHGKEETDKALGEYDIKTVRSLGKLSEADLQDLYTSVTE